MGLFALFWDDIKNLRKRIPSFFFNPLDLSIGLSNSNGNTVSVRVNDASTTHTYTLPVTQGGLDQFLRTDGNGNLSWSSLVSSSLNYSNSNFEVENPAGEDTFDIARNLEGRFVTVSVNGIVQRKGSTYDYVFDGTRIVFNYLVPRGFWVNVITWNAFADSANYRTIDFTSDPGGQSTFDLGEDLAGKNVIVSQNGIIRREGALYDFYISGSAITFNYLIPENHWIQVQILH